MNNKKKMKKIIDITEIKSSKELQKKLKKELAFPEFYGMNWEAFWDAITGLVELPEVLVIRGWNNIVETLPSDTEIMRALFEKFNKNYPMCNFIVEYI